MTQLLFGPFDGRQVQVVAMVGDKVIIDEEYVYYGTGEQARDGAWLAVFGQAERQRAESTLEVSMST